MVIYSSIRLLVNCLVEKKGLTKTEFNDGYSGGMLVRKEVRVWVRFRHFMSHLIDFFNSNNSC